jgi:Mg2+/Co2+ transporter CorB
MQSALVISLVAIFFLLVAGAFFSAAETALTTASRARMHQLERTGNKRAQLVAKLNESR